jgi:hypothetical protein
MEANTIGYSFMGALFLLCMTIHNINCGMTVFLMTYAICRVNPEPCHKTKPADFSGCMAFSGPLDKLALLQKLACAELFLMRFNVPILWVVSFCSLVHLQA